MGSRHTGPIEDLLGDPVILSCVALGFTSCRNFGTYSQLRTHQLPSPLSEVRCRLMNARHDRVDEIRSLYAFKCFPDGLKVQQVSDNQFSA